MIEYIGNLATLYTALIEGFLSINLDSKSRKKQHIQIKIYTIRNILDDIVETADKTFSIVDLKLNKEVKLNPDSEKELKYLAYSQANNLHQLLMNLDDDTFAFIQKLFSPHLGGDIYNNIGMKKNCLLDQIRHLYNVDKYALQKMYNLDNYLLGLKQLSRLKKCSKELSSFIAENIDFQTKPNSPPTGSSGQAPMTK